MHTTHFSSSLVRTREVLSKTIFEHKQTRVIPDGEIILNTSYYMLQMKYDEMLLS
jgi:hypothetical protein